MASAREDGVNERMVDIKEEDCERLKPDDVCVKLENHEERISVFKEEEECKEVTTAVKAEDLNDFSIGLERQKHETEDIFKQDACEESPSSLQPWSTNTRRLATQENSAELKSELSESEEKITEENGREGEESPGSVGIKFCPHTLDINKAHRDLNLSEGSKKVTCEGAVTKYPDHLERFDWWSHGLRSEALTWIRCYSEVECSERLLRLGVAYKGLSRKEDGEESLLGYNDKHWGLQCCVSQ
ncbi:STXB protein, partial [Polypterus senegalus]